MYKSRSYIQTLLHKVKKLGVFKQGDVLKQMFYKGYKMSFRMYLNAELIWKIEFMGK